VSHYGLAIYIKKYLKAEVELWKFKYLTMQKYNLQKNPLKETKILQDIITNFKFQHKPKYHLSKSLYKNRPITLGGESLQLLYSVMNLNTISSHGKAKNNNLMNERKNVLHITQQAPLNIKFSRREGPPNHHFMVV